MTPEDRELLQVLRQQQLDLKRTLARLDFQLETLEARAKATDGEIPAAPTQALVPPLPPVLPASALQASPSAPLFPWPAPAESKSQPLPPVPPRPPLVTPPVPAPPKLSLEFQFGRWLIRIGAVLGIITLVLIFSVAHGYIFQHLGPAGILGLSAALCLGIVALAGRMERRNPKLLVFTRSFMAMGLAGLYVTFYAAHSFDSVRIIENPILAGVLLLAWSAYVFGLAERKSSQTLALFSIALAYFSTAINPIGRFTMAADLLLAGTAVAFLLRNGWSALSYVSLAGTYFALLRRLVMDEHGELVLDTGRVLSFTPYATYLACAWIIFTAAVLLAKSPSFRGGKRFAFLSLNNAALAGLLTLTTHISGYDLKAMGWTLLGTGVAFLVTALVAKIWHSDEEPSGVAGAYLAQGIAVFTAGLMGVFSGVTRGLLLALETLLIGYAAASSRNIVLKICTAVAALWATFFLLWEIGMNGHHSWLLGLGGALTMLVNAWWSRRDLRLLPLAQQRLVLFASYYCTLALGLLAAALATELNDSLLPPALALAAVALTFSIYLVPLFELPPLAQSLLVAAQALVLFPKDTGEELPRTSIATVAAFTLLILGWWSRQRVTRSGPWMVALNLIYALALVGLAYHAVRPYVDPQGWMVGASLLSVVFLIFGAWTRVWPLAVMGQLFLGVAVYHFFNPPTGLDSFPWTWAAAGVPIAVVFAAGRALRVWVRDLAKISADLRLVLCFLGYVYQLAALAMVIRWIFGVIPASEQLATFFLVGTLLLAWNTYRRKPFGIRSSFVPSALGVLLVLETLLDQRVDFINWLNGAALFFFLCQPTLLQHLARQLITAAESWLVILLSAVTGWIFVGTWVVTRIHANYLTMGWALYALFLFLFGLLVRERRQRWCGLVILALAMIRVLAYDIWGFSNGYKVLTFVVLTLITLGVGFIYARFAEKLKTWL